MTPKWVNANDMLRRPTLGQIIHTNILRRALPYAAALRPLASIMVLAHYS